MAFELKNLFEDVRLERLFTDTGRDCALQLWIIQTKVENIVVNKIIYGRLLPYSFSSNKWFMTDDDNFKNFGNYQSQILRLNLYTKSSKSKRLINLLSEGKDLNHISAELELNLSEKHGLRIGKSQLELPVVFRPVVYLFNRDSHNIGGLLSPHGSAGAFSASISQVDKIKFFQFGEDFDSELSAFIIEHLNNETGLSFGNKDINRIGEIELLVFPTLDDNERELLSVVGNDQSTSFLVKLNTIQIPYYKSFMVRLSVSNDNLIIHSSISSALNIENNEINCEFEIPEHLCLIIDSTEVEIYGLNCKTDNFSNLCCRWQINYIREVSINSHMISNQSSTVRLGWLERVIKSQNSSNRLQAVQAVNQGNLGFTSNVGDRKNDMWIPVNRKLRNLLAKLHPPRSDGKFFERLNERDGLSRLDFAEWIKKLLIDSQDYQVIFFDPYFEDAGIGLIVPNAGNNGDYIVFTTLPAPAKQEELRWYSQLKISFNKIFRQQTPYILNNRINNLVTSCEQLKPFLKGVNLRVFGLKAGALHDRYILVIGKDGLPISGFNLSNSIQKASENYPLLITPIPKDILLKVVKYAKEVLNQASFESDGDNYNIPRAQIIFDSSSILKSTRKHYERLSFLDYDLAGEVLAGWTGELSLSKLSGENLRKNLSILKLLEDKSLNLNDDFKYFGNYLSKISGNYNDFKKRWVVIADILANTHTGDLIDTANLFTQRSLLINLGQYLTESFSREFTEEVDAPIASIARSHFTDSIDLLMAGPYQIHHFHHYVKYAALTWSELYAIRLLWIYDPDLLLTIVENQVKTFKTEDQKISNLEIPLLSQIVSEIAFSSEFNINTIQIERLISSPNGLLKWMGLSSLLNQLNNTESVVELEKHISSFDYSAKVKALGWMTNQKASDHKQIEVFLKLISSLHTTLVHKINSKDANLLVNSLRGHMKRLGWCEPWLFQDVINPLLNESRVTPEELCDIWIDDLESYLQEIMNRKFLNFDRNREGRVTEIAAYLLANSSISKQNVIFKRFKKMIANISREVRQPLASTQNWSKWDSSLGIALWILVFLSWINHFLVRPNQVNTELELLIREAREIALIRPIAEWKSERRSSTSQLVQLLEELEQLN